MISDDDLERILRGYTEGLLTVNQVNAMIHAPRVVFVNKPEVNLVDAYAAIGIAPDGMGPSSAAIARALGLPSTTCAVKGCDHAD